VKENMMNVGNLDQKLFNKPIIQKKQNNRPGRSHEKRISVNPQTKG
jgi:hypothetical protein